MFFCSYHFYEGLGEACKVLECSLENEEEIDENDLVRFPSSILYLC